MKTLRLYRTVHMLVVFKAITLSVTNHHNLAPLRWWCGNQEPGGDILLPTVRLESARPQTGLSVVSVGLVLSSRP